MNIYWSKQMEVYLLLVAAGSEFFWIVRKIMSCGMNRASRELLFVSLSLSSLLREKRKKKGNGYFFLSS
jgi:hypothetical protein